jgi:GAF domain-containing protein
MTELRAAVAAGVLGSEEQHRALLRAIVEVARAIFGAQASSIMLLDEEADELVFEAVAREEEQHLVGRRFPSSTGIAGWVLVTRQPLVIEDVRQDPRFAKGVAEETGYVPKGLMAVPLLHEEQALGVLQVLDRPQQSRFSLQEMELLGLFANQAAIALDLLQRARRAEGVLGSAGGDAAAVARLASAVESLEDEQRAAGLRLVAALAEVLGT